MKVLDLMVSKEHEPLLARINFENRAVLAFMSEVIIEALALGDE